MSLEQLEKRLQALEDLEEIKKLHQNYINLMDNLRYEEVLDLFTGWERPGVDFKFDRYFPEDFSACIPLHEYLSEEFQKSTVDFVKRWVDEARSPELIKALETATGDFEEERDADIPS